MGETIEYADGSPVKIKKKSKKNKNMTDDPLPFGGGNNHVDTDGGHSKKKNKDKHREKKSKPESKEDGETDGDCLKKKYTEKHTEKKRKSESKEDGETDGVHSKKKRRDKHREKTGKSESKEDIETDGDHSKKKKRDKHREKTGKSESKEDVDEDQHDTGKLVNDDLQKKNKKRKRKHSSEKAQIKENEMDQNDVPGEEKDCDPKSEKKKTDAVKDGSEDTFKKINKKKKKKKDGNKSMTEESTLKAQDMDDKSTKKQKVKVKDSKVSNKTGESVENNTEKPKAKSKAKKVSFSGHVEVFPTSDTQPEKETTKGDGLIRGKRFTPEEDEIIKQAVLDYITAKGLGEDGLKIVLNCKSHRGMKKCWQEIGICLPNRPHLAVYYRAHILFERSENRSWSPEEIELLKEFHEKHGNDWKKLAEELGKHRFHVKDTWRRIKLENLKKGRWSQEEYQNLYDLVNLDLQMKVSGEEKRKSKHGMLRDNIPWTAISEKLSTRSDATCCDKWYNQLTSSLVAEKKWSDADDYRMIGALYEIDAACVDDVDWDNLLEHRPGEICLKRWNQMVKHIGDYGSKAFGEQVDILAKRYCPDMAETREVWDSKPVVP